MQLLRPFWLHSGSMRVDRVTERAGIDVAPSSTEELTCGAPECKPIRADTYDRFETKLC